MTHETGRIGRVDCTTADCQGQAERYVSCEDEGFYPYCRDCAATLLSGGETDSGAVDDPVVAERDLYRAAIREAMDIMGNSTDRELGEGGIARKAYARLYHAYFSIPADTYRAAFPRERS